MGDALQFVIFRDRDGWQLRDRYLLIISIYIFQQSGMFRGVAVCMCPWYLHNEPHYISNKFLSNLEFVRPAIFIIDFLSSEFVI